MRLNDGMTGRKKWTENVEDQNLLSVKHSLAREILQGFTKSTTKVTCLSKGMERHSVSLSQGLLVKTAQYRDQT